MPAFGSAARRIALALLVLVAGAGCSLISIDLNPRIRPLEEETVDGAGAAKILLLTSPG
jgi:hypothetical protein